MSDQADRVTERDLVVIPFRDVLDAMARALVVTSPRGDILVWNAAAEHLYGWSEDEVSGRSAVEILVGEALRPLRRSWASSLPVRSGGATSCSATVTACRCGSRS